MLLLSLILYLIVFGLAVQSKFSAEIDVHWLSAHLLFIFLRFGDFKTFSRFFSEDFERLLNYHCLYILNPHYFVFVHFVFYLFHQHILSSVLLHYLILVFLYWLIQLSTFWMELYFNYIFHWRTINDYHSNFSFIDQGMYSLMFLILFLSCISSLFNHFSFWQHLIYSSFYFELFMNYYFVFGFLQLFLNLAFIFRFQILYSQTCLRNMSFFIL